MIGYKGQHIVHQRGGQIYWRAKHGEMEGINNGFALFSSENLFGENQKTRLSVRFGLKGTQEYHIGSAHLKVNQNQFLVMNEGTEYTIAAQNNEDVTALAFCFNEDFVSDFVSYHRNTSQTLLDEFGLYDLKGEKLEFPLHTLLVNENVQNNIQTVLEAKAKYGTEEVDDYSIFNRVLYLIFSEFDSILKSFDHQGVVKKSTKVELYKRLSIARDYVQAHFMEDVNLNELSRVACLSPYHFHRAFKQTFGLTPKKFVTGLRIERAKWLLLNRPMSVQMVCQAVGFKDVSSFTRLFAGYTGSTPSVYRKETDALISLSA